MKIPFVQHEIDVQIKQKILYALSKVDEEFICRHDSPKKKIVVGLACDYGNLGDVAISLAQQDFLEKNYPTHQVIIFPISETFTKMKSLEALLAPDDVITLVGGGNSGDIYPDIEFARQFILKKFPQNTIISFPQTLDYTPEVAEKKLKKDKKTYQQHPRLKLAAREEKSCQAYTTFYEKESFLCPDIVLSWKKELPQVKRSGILLCLRQDKEKNIQLPTDFLGELKAQATLTFRDTQLDVSHLPLEKGKQEVEDILKEFSKKELVITDRLHGMIFSAITGTPCIALDNQNRKVSGVHKLWLEKRFSQIRVIKEQTSNDELLALVTELKGKNYAFNPDTSPFKQLMESGNK